MQATRVVDLGCGTDILTVTLAAAGRDVLGVDPSAAMLRHARPRPGAEAVRWVLGDSTAIAPARADLALMPAPVTAPERFPGSSPVFDLDHTSS